MDSSITEFVTDVLAVKLALVFIIIFGGMIVHFAFCRFCALFHKRQYISEPFFQVCRNISRWIVLLFVVLFSLQQFGLKISTLLTSMLTIAAMVAIGFIAIWSVLSNFLCSFLIIIFSPFRIGDDIEICEVMGGEGLRGKVVDFNFMYTILLEAGEQPEDEKAIIRIPNNTFFQKAIKRWKGVERQSIEKHIISKSLINIKKD